MSKESYACVHAAQFPAQTLVRLRNELRAQPFAVLEGHTPLETVCSINTLAHHRGAVLQMTRVEAEAIPGLRMLPRSPEGEASARAVLLECAANFSPRIEDVSSDTVCSCVIDIAGTERLFGPPHAIAQRIRAVLAAAGFRISVAVSANFHTARTLAAFTRRTAVVSAGDEAAALAALPIHALQLPNDYAETFASWGIQTLGALAALDEAELVTRFGLDARDWRDLALGAYPHTFQPIEPNFQLSEFYEFESPIEQMESLLFVSARMLDCLIERAIDRALCIAQLSVDMKLESGETHTCTMRPALPSVDRKFLLKLMQLEVAAHPPPRGVVALTLSAEAGTSSKVQLGLFSPQTPEPSRLDVTLARLKAIVGQDHVGSPVLEDTHHPGSFRMESFHADGKPSAHREAPRVALRRMRPPLQIRVLMVGAQPSAFYERHNSYRIEAAYGPWRSSGCWWSAKWHIEEWDVLAKVTNSASVACLLSHDRAQNAWRLEAFYD
ncbi:MAG: DNA polymerase Y family protein [Acidobacteriota bacterium]|nr:DNA polymerase Y family protein [Acidobacteriota bacterium]